MVVNEARILLKKLGCVNGVGQHVFMDIVYLFLGHCNFTWCTKKNLRAIARNTCPISGHIVRGNWHFVHNLKNFCWIGVKIFTEHL
jgi:hypothetical protein